MSFRVCGSDLFTCMCVSGFNSSGLWNENIRVKRNETQRIYVDAETGCWRLPSVRLVCVCMWRLINKGVITFFCLQLHARHRFIQILNRPSDRCMAHMNVADRNVRFVICTFSDRLLHFVSVEKSYLFLPNKLIAMLFFQLDNPV